MRPPVRKHVLVRIREELGLQQKELANLLGVSTSTIKRVELLSLKLSRHLARRMSEALGVSMDYLLKNELFRRPVTPGGGRWTKEYAKFSKPAPAFMRLWHLLPTWIVLSRCCKYLSAIRAVQNPLQSAWLLAKHLDRAFNEFMKAHHAKLRDFPGLELSDMVSDAEEVVHAEIAIHDGGYDERASVLFSIAQGDAESALLLPDGMEFPTDVKRELVSLLEHDHSSPLRPQAKP
jgi:transcriptional regulator with XRE-family HTH domain